LRNGFSTLGNDRALTMFGCVYKCRELRFPIKYANFFHVSIMPLRGLPVQVLYPDGNCGSMSMASPKEKNR